MDLIFSFIHDESTQYKGIIDGTTITSVVVE